MPKRIAIVNTWRAGCRVALANCRGFYGRYFWTTDGPSQSQRYAVGRRWVIHVSVESDAPYRGW